MKIEQMSIDELGLSGRCQNALHRMGVHTVGDLMGCTEESLSVGKNLGKKSVEEILTKLEAYKNAGEGGLPEAGASSPAPSSDCVDFQTWLADASHRALVTEYLKEKGSRVDELELLSARAFNRLMLQGYEEMHEIAFLTLEESLPESPLRGEVDLGFMLYDLVYRTDAAGRATDSAEPRFYRPRMVDGGVNVAAYAKELVC